MSDSEVSEPPDQKSRVLDSDLGWDNTAQDLEDPKAKSSRSKSFLGRVLGGGRQKGSQQPFAAPMGPGQQQQFQQQQPGPQYHQQQPGPQFHQQQPGPQFHQQQPGSNQQVPQQQQIPKPQQRQMQHPFQPQQFQPQQFQPQQFQPQQFQPQGPHPAQGQPQNWQGATPSPGPASSNPTPSPVPPNPPATPVPEDLQSTLARTINERDRVIVDFRVLHKELLGVEFSSVLMAKKLREDKAKWDEESQQLRKEIEPLKEENFSLREKVLELTQENAMLRNNDPKLTEFYNAQAQKKLAAEISLSKSVELLRAEIESVMSSSKTHQQAISGALTIMVQEMRVVLTNQAELQLLRAEYEGRLSNLRKQLAALRNFATKQQQFHENQIARLQQSADDNAPPIEPMNPPVPPNVLDDETVDQSNSGIDEWRVRVDNKLDDILNAVSQTTSTLENSQLLALGVENMVSLLQAAQPRNLQPQATEPQATEPQAEEPQPTMPQATEPEPEPQFAEPGEPQTGDDHGSDSQSDDSSNSDNNDDSSNLLPRSRVQPIPDQASPAPQTPTSSAQLPRVVSSTSDALRRLDNNHDDEDDSSPKPSPSMTVQQGTSGLQRSIVSHALPQATLAQLPHRTLLLSSTTPVPMDNTELTQCRQQLTTATSLVVSQREQLASITTQLLAKCQMTHNHLCSRLPDNFPIPEVQHATDEEGENLNNLTTTIAKETAAGKPLSHDAVTAGVQLSRAFDRLMRTYFTLLPAVINAAVNAQQQVKQREVELQRETGERLRLQSEGNKRLQDIQTTLRGLAAAIVDSSE